MRRFIDLFQKTETMEDLLICIENRLILQVSLVSSPDEKEKERDTLWG